MKRLYIRLRIGLMAFALGLAAVYMSSGLSIAWNTVPVELPTASQEVIHIFPASYRDASRYYIPDEGEIIDGRDLSLYDVAGYVESCVGADDWRACLKERAAARQFVYDHWKEKRRGYIAIGHFCIDCSPTDHIFIEPDTSGDWRIVTTLESNGPLHTEQATSVKFRRATKDERHRTFSKTVLSLLDTNGNEIDKF